MLRLAITDNPFFEASDIELNRRGKSYSIETLHELAGLYKGSAELFFILGADSFLEIGTWKDYGQLFYLANFIVAARPGYIDGLDARSAIASLPVDIRDCFCYDSKSYSIVHSSGHRTYLIKTTLLEISSSDLRQKVYEGKSIKYLLPLDVENFIKEQGLYKKET